MVSIYDIKDIKSLLNQVYVIPVQLEALQNYPDIQTKMNRKFTELFKYIKRNEMKFWRIIPLYKRK